MGVKYAGHVIVFEFKMVEEDATPGGNSALAQILENGYADQYRGGTETIHLVGIEFSKSKRAIVAWEVAKDEGRRRKDEGQSTINNQQSPPLNPVK
jgi:hypothetical protein